MKRNMIIFLTLLSFLLISKQSKVPLSCTGPVDNNYGNYAIIKGTVDYYIDTLVWAGGECDPKGFILKDYTWIIKEPYYAYYRVYVNSLIDSSYMNYQVKIFGKVKTIFSGGIVTQKRRFPMIESDSIAIITNKTD